MIFHSYGSLPAGIFFWWLGGEPWKPNMLRYLFGVFTCQWCWGYVSLPLPRQGHTCMAGTWADSCSVSAPLLVLDTCRKKRLANVHAHCTYPFIAKTWFVPIYLYKVDTLKGSTSKKASWYEVGFPPFCLRPTPPASICPRCASNVLSNHG